MRLFGRLGFSLSSLCLFVISYPSVSVCQAGDVPVGNDLAFPLGMRPIPPVELYQEQSSRVIRQQDSVSLVNSTLAITNSSVTGKRKGRKLRKSNKSRKRKNSNLTKPFKGTNLDFSNDMKFINFVISIKSSTIPTTPTTPKAFNDEPKHDYKPFSADYSPEGRLAAEALNLKLLSADDMPMMEDPSGSHSPSIPKDFKRSQDTSELQELDSQIDNEIKQVKVRMTNDDEVNDVRKAAVVPDIQKDVTKHLVKVDGVKIQDVKQRMNNLGIESPSTTPHTTSSSKAPAVPVSEISTSTALAVDFVSPRLTQERDDTHNPSLPHPLIPWLSSGKYTRKRKKPNKQVGRTDGEGGIRLVGKTRAGVVSPSGSSDLSNSTLYNPCRKSTDCASPLLCNANLNYGTSQGRAAVIEDSAEETLADVEQDFALVDTEPKKCMCPAGTHEEFILDNKSYQLEYFVSCGLGPEETCVKNEDCASNKCRNDTSKCDFVLPAYGLFFISSIYQNVASALSNPLSLFYEIVGILILHVAMLYQV